MGLGGGDRPFSEHETGTHSAARPEECVTRRRFIRRQRPRQPLEGGSGSEEAPLLA